MKGPNLQQVLFAPSLFASIPSVLYRNPSGFACFALYHNILAHIFPPGLECEFCEDKAQRLQFFSNHGTEQNMRFIGSAQYTVLQERMSRWWKASLSCQLQHRNHFT